MSTGLKVLPISALIILAILGIANATITFSEFPVGTDITNQYAPDNVLFSPGPIGNADPIIADDSAMPNSPVLSPNPPFAGDFFMTFPTPIAGVVFDSGYWDELQTGVIDVYGPGDVLLETLTNQGLGVFTFDISGVGPIAKIYFNSSVDPAGADIDNLRTVPEPATMILLGSGLLGLWGARRKSKK